MAHSGFYKELIRVDDFLNAINDLRVGAHMNDEVNTLDSVRKVRGQGFTVYGSVSNLGDADAIVALDSSHTSDTRYPRTVQQDNEDERVRDEPDAERTKKKKKM